jgi:hypothetical protein
VDDEGDYKRTANRVRLPAFFESLEARVGAHVLDEEEAAASEGTERELEEPLGEIGVRSFEPAGRRGGQPVAFAQVHGDVSARGQLCDPLDRGLQGVRKGELGDCLADDADDRLRAPKRGCDQAHSAAAPERERRTRRERHEDREDALVRLRVEVELQRADRRLPERDGRDAGARSVVARRASGHEGPLAIGERGPDVLLPLAMVGGVAVEPVPCEERGRGVGLDAPERCADRPRGEGGKADDLLRRLRFVRSGDEGFAEELERQRPPVGPQLVSARPFEPHGDSDVRRREAREHALALLERCIAGAVELQGGDDPLAEAGEVNPDYLRPRSRGDVADRVREAFVRARRVRLDLLRIEPVEAQPGALELGGERGGP